MTRGFALGTSLLLLAAPGCSSNGSGGTEESGTADGGTQTGETAATSAGPTTSDPQTTTQGSGKATSAGETGEDTSADGSTGGQPECPYETVDGMPQVGLELVGQGFDRPVLALGHPSEPDRLFVVEQGGHVKILEPGQTEAPAESFLTVDVQNANNTDSVGPEQGLLGFAFHPDYPSDPRVYAAYNPAGGGATPTTVQEFTVDGNEVAQPGRIVIAVDQPASNHNGGMIAFGPDGYLYFGLGDGGLSNDAFDTSRNLSLLLAKMVRIDVEPDGADDFVDSCANDCEQLGPFDYTIPADNPFVGQEGVAPEIYAWGLRNPWRFAFDSVAEVLYAADVGQEAHEEINVIASGSDYGWDVLEANNAGPGCGGGGEPPCDTSADPGEPNGEGNVAPIAEYSSNGTGECSVTGLSVYRSCEVEAWDGVYFYADYCSGNVRGLVMDDASLQDLGVVASIDERVMGNGWNAYGDVYLTTVELGVADQIVDGKVYRIAPAR